MANSYYLMNEKKGNTNALWVPVNDITIYKFEDISQLDLATINIKKGEAVSILTKYNFKDDVNGQLFISQYPVKKTHIKSYYPIFASDNDSLNKLFEEFSYFAKQRLEKKENNESVKLDEDANLKNFVQLILEQIVESNNDKLLAYDCLISSRMKDILRSRNDEEYKMYNTDYFFKSNMHRIMQHYTTYTELRNLIITYLLWKNNESVNLRRKTKGKENYIYTENNFIPNRKIDDYYQMTIDDYIKVRK